MNIEKIPFAVAITPEVKATIKDPTDPVGLQYVPQEAELNIQPFELADPISDEKHSPVKGIVHRYPDRVLLKISNVCPVYCRFCFRKTMIGPGSKALGPDDRKNAVDYIQSHSEIWEVILTGGDPLILNPKYLRQILEKLDQIKHVKIIRIHTRVPVTDPNRISDELLKSLKITKPIYIVVHANHANEFSAIAKTAIAKLADNGFPLLSQSVLLKNVNDNTEALSTLMKTFVENRIKPYYIHQLDPAPGTSHFHVSIEKGQALMKALRGNISGLCQPTYVVDIPGGFGKSPITPSYLSEERIEDFEGNSHRLQKVQLT